MVTEFFEDDVFPAIRTRKERKQARNKNKQLAARSRNQKPASPGLILGAIYPKTDNQIKIFSEYNQGKALNITGLAGTGKSFTALYLALFDIMNGVDPYKKVVIIRSAASVRSQGFLPGSKKEKEAVYETPYIGICAELFGRDDAYEVLKSKGIIEFESTSYLRGITLRDSIVIFDEGQNALAQEISSVITRIGETSRFIMISDHKQSDLKYDDERAGYHRIQKVLKKMPSVGHIEMGPDDIVRSGFVKEFLVADAKVPQ